MPYQFIHIETYARQRTASGKWSMSDVVAEALREDGACDHVAQPAPPTVLHGVGGSALLAAIDDLDRDAVQAIDSIGRKLRKDAQILLAGVASFPVRVEDLKSSASDYMRWRGRVLAFLQDEYSDSLVSVLQHLDEEYPHLHFVVRAPQKGLALDLGELQPGRYAARDRKLPAAERRRLYRDAMQRYQARFFEKVGKPSGMTPTGPRKRRLTREQWKSEQESAKVLAEVEDLRDVVTEKSELLKEAFAEIRRLQNEYATATTTAAVEPKRKADGARQSFHRGFSPTPF
jgi:hypothetical protein